MLRNSPLSPMVLLSFSIPAPGQKRGIALTAKRKSTVFSNGKFTSLVTFFALLLVLFPFEITTLAQQGTVKPRVALLEFKRVDVSEAEVSSVSEQLRNDLVKTRRFTVLDREQTEAVLKEMAFQQEGITDQKQAVKIGKLLNVEFIVTGVLIALPGAYQVSVKMIRVETGEIERSETIVFRGDIIGLLSGNMSTIATSLTQVESGAQPPLPPQPAPAAPPEPPPEPAGVSVGLLAGGGLLGILAVQQYLEAVDLHEKAQDKAQKDPDKSRELEAERDTAAVNAIIAGLIGVGLVVWAFSDSMDGAAAQSEGWGVAPLVTYWNGRSMPTLLVKFKW